jgi:hypothetical protein
MARTMLMNSKLIDIFWTQAVDTTIHIKKNSCSEATLIKLPTSYGKEDQQM